VLILGPRFDALAKQRTVGVGIDGFVQQHAVEVARERERVGGTAQDDLQDLGVDLILSIA